MPTIRTVPAILDAAAAERPNQHFLTVATEPAGSLSLSEFRQLARQFGSAMQGLGITMGDRVGIMGSNSVEFLQAWFGCHLIGAIAVPINTALRGDALEHIVRLAEPKIIVADTAYAPRVLDAIVAASAECDLVVIDKNEHPTESSLVASSRQKCFHALDFTRPLDAVVIHESDIASIMYTSGTTGPSKGVVWTHGATHHMGWVPGESMAYGPDDVLYICLPLFHASALVNLMLTGLMHGARVVITDRFSVRQFWPDVHKFGITATNILGAMGAMLQSRTPDDFERNHHLRTAMVVPAPAGTAQVFRERFGIDIVHPYGLTDIGWITWPRRGDHVPEGSVGRAHPAFEVRIVDDADRSVTAGAPGELVARPKQPWTTPIGYWAMPQETLDAQRNLWFHTGDLLRQDSDGWLYFVDRAKDAMRRRGENVSSFEVEQAFRKHPAVTDCAAYGITSSLTEDEIAVALVLHKGQQTCHPAELIAFVEPHLPYFAVPRYVRILESLPKTQTEKVLKVQLRGDGVTSDMWDADAAGIRISR